MQNRVIKSLYQLGLFLSSLVVFGSTAVFAQSTIQQNNGGLQQGISTQNPQFAQPSTEYRNGTVDPVQISQQGLETNGLEVTGAPVATTPVAEKSSREFWIYLLIAALGLAAAVALFARSKKVPEPTGSKQEIIEIPEETDDAPAPSDGPEPVVAEAEPTPVTVKVSVESETSPKQSSAKPSKKKKNKKKKSKRKH